MLRFLRLFFAFLGIAVTSTFLRAQTPPAASQPAEGAAFKAALLLTAPPTDMGWNEQAFRALKAVEKTLPAQVKSTVIGLDRPYLDEIREYARAGFNLVICHGGEYGKGMLQPDRRGQSLVARFPKTVFLNTGGEADGPANFQAVSFRLEEACYLAGIVAGHVTKSKKVGAIGGQDFASVQRCLRAFVNGARSVNPNIEGTMVYANTWDSPLLAKDAVTPLLAKGADVIFQNTNAASQGIFEACQSAGAWTFGCNGNQNDDARFANLLLGSAVMDMEKLFVDRAAEVRSGTFKGGPTFKATIANGYISYLPNPKTLSRQPADLTAKLEEAKKKIIKGELDVLKEP